MTIGVELGYFKADTVKELSLHIDSLANRVNKLQQTLTPGKQR